MLALTLLIMVAIAPPIERDHAGPAAIEAPNPRTAVDVEVPAPPAANASEGASAPAERDPAGTTTASMDASERSSGDAPGGASGDASRDASRDTPTDASIDASRDTSGDASRDASGDASPTPSGPRPIHEILQPTLLGELDYRVYPSEAEGATGFALGRFRMGLRYSPRPWAAAVGTVEYADKAPYLLDANLLLTPRPWLEFGLGYAKAPLFPSFRYEPVHTMPFADRAPVIGAFRVRRDLGAEVHLMPRRAPIEAIVRIGNGSGTITANDNPLPAGYALIDLVLGRPRPDHAYDRLGLRLGLGGMIESVRGRDGISGQTPMGFVYYQGAPISGRRGVLEAHAIGYVGTLRLTFESALAREARSVDDDGDPDTPAIAADPITSAGLTGELAWVAMGGARTPGRAPTLTGRGGALELAARFDAMALGRGALDVTPGGSLGGALSMKWWLVDFLAVNVVGYYTRFDYAPIAEPDRTRSWGVLARLSIFLGAAKAPRRPRGGGF